MKAVNAYRETVLTSSAKGDTLNRQEEVHDRTSFR